MNDYLIKKVIAYDGEREVVESSTEEKHQFIVEGIRPDFNDPHVICVKFLYCLYEDDEEPEESSWYINPYYCQNSGFGRQSAYGPQMAAEFIPELLLITSHPISEVLKKYDSFNTMFVIRQSVELPDDEKIELFLKRYSQID